MRKVEIIKIATILGYSSRSNGFLPVMMISFNRGDIGDYYSEIVRDICKDEFVFQKTSMDIINSNKSYPFNTTVVLDIEPVVGKSLNISAWRSSAITKIIDNNIIITNNSVYALHNVSELRDKKLNDLGI